MYGMPLFTAFLGEGGTKIETVVNSHEAAIAKVSMNAGVLACFTVVDPEYMLGRSEQVNVHVRGKPVDMGKSVVWPKILKYWIP